LRTTFINQLIKEARENKDIFFLVGDLGYSVVEPFAIEFPERFLNVGIAEQNMAGIAAGLAMEGYNVFIYSIGNFPTLRCMEQIRYDICYHNLNVKIVAVGAGYSYGSLGPSHHATEELGMLRIIPNLAILTPSDPIEAKVLTHLLSKKTGPAYLRLGKSGEKQVHPDELSFNWGDIIEVINGKNTAVVCNGSILNYCFDYITQNKLGWGLYSIPFIKPISEKKLLDLFLQYEKITTIEEHQKTGGLGSMLLESANKLRNSGELLSVPMIDIRGIDDLFYSNAGSQSFLRKEMKIYL